MKNYNACMLWLDIHIRSPRYLCTIICMYASERANKNVIVNEKIFLSMYVCKKKNKRQEERREHRV